MGWRRCLKLHILSAFEFKCGICGYNKCTDALEFHHLIPNNKDFSISNIEFSNLDSIISELKKCVCLCSNCHREIHTNLIIIPNSIITYNSDKSKDIVNFCNLLYKKNNKVKKRKHKQFYKPLKKFY